MKSCKYMFVIGIICYAINGFSMELDSHLRVFKIVNWDKGIKENDEVAELKKLMIEELAKFNSEDLKEINILHVTSKVWCGANHAGLQVNFIYHKKRNSKLEDKLSEIIEGTKNDNGSTFMLDRIYPFKGSVCRQNKGWEKIWPK